MIDPLKWWRAALAGEKPPITEDPQPGFYKRKLVKGGPFVPVHIWLVLSQRDEAGDRMCDEKLFCAVDGRLVDVDLHWSYCCASPITEAEFDYLSKVSQYAKANNQREPLANPRRKINALSFPLPTFTTTKRKR